MDITAEWLASRGICDRDHAVFVAEWGDGAPLSRAGLLRAAELGLFPGWLAHHLLPRDSDGLRQFEVARDAIDRAHAAALDAHPAHQTYRAACRAHNASLKQAIATAGADMRARQATATSQAEHDAATAAYHAASQAIHDDHKVRREANEAEWTTATAPLRTVMYQQFAVALADILGLP